MKRNVSSQKGVHALFTARSERKRGLGEAIGLVTAIAGASVWMSALSIFLGTLQPLLVPDRTSSSVIMLSIAILMIVTGSTTFAYSRASRKSGEELPDSESLTREVEALTGLRSNKQSAFQPIVNPRSRWSRAEIVAIVEVGIIILLYGGLLRDYDSSVFMREWVENNLPVATFILNDNLFFLVVGVVVATVAFHLISRKNHR